MKTWTLYGTSLTAAGPWVDDFKAWVTSRWGEEYTVVNAAKSGEHSRWGLSQLEERVLSTSPDRVLMEFAINDAHTRFALSLEESRQNLERMLDRIQEQNPDVEIVLWTTNPVFGEKAEQRTQLEAYYAQVLDVARAYGLLALDVHAAWKRALADNPGAETEWIPDGLHPGTAGAKAVILPALLNGLSVLN